MGSLDDKVGRKRALQVGLIIFRLSSFFAAYAESSSQLIATRALMGIGLGPVTGGILLEYFLGGSVFFINIPIVLIAIIAGLILVPESKTPNPVPLQLDSSPYLI